MHVLINCSILSLHEVITEITFGGTAGLGGQPLQAEASLLHGRMSTTL
jgi:hypothetical protein